MNPSLLLLSLLTPSLSQAGFFPTGTPHEPPPDLAPLEGKALRHPLHDALLPAAFQMAKHDPATLITQYRYELRLDPEEGTLQGTALLMVSRSPGPSPLTLDLVGLEVYSVKIAGEEVAYTHEDGVVEIPMEEEITSLEIQVDYGGEAIPDEDGRGLTVSSEMIYSFTEPDGTRLWLPLMDEPWRKAPLVLSVTLPEDLKLLSNGWMSSDETEEEGWHTVTWETSFPIAPYLISLAASHFEVQEEEWNGVPVSYWVNSGLADQVAVDFQDTPEMMGVFSDLFFPYPFEKYAMAVVPMGSMAMEHQTATSFGSSLISGDGGPAFVVAHELMHHWWGDWVTCATWDDIWLNEGGASYGEALWAEALEGEAGYRQYLGWQADSYFAWTDYEGIFPIAQPDYMWGGTVYDKGSFIFSMLRDTLGDEAFFTAMVDYADAHGMASATTSQLQEALELSSGRDLGVFFDQWVYGPGHPVLLWSWRKTPLKDGSWQVDVSLRQVQEVDTVFTLSLPWEVDLGKNVEEGVLEVNQQEQAFSLCLLEEPLFLDLDPQGRILHQSYSDAEDSSPFQAACGSPASGESTTGENDDPPVEDDDTSGITDDDGPLPTEDAEILLGSGCGCQGSPTTPSGLAFLILLGMSGWVTCRNRRNNW